MLIDRWHPVTSDMGLVNAPVDACVDAFLQWGEADADRYRSWSVPSLQAILEALPPLSMEKRRMAFVPTSAGWTALFQSGIAGSDPFLVTNRLATTLLRVLGMRVCVSPSGAKWPAVVWEVYAPPELGGDSPLGYRRYLAAMNDGGRWVFEQTGESYSFEQTARYRLPRTRERFTRDMLEAYLQQFGLAPQSDAFYPVGVAQPAIVLERPATGGVCLPEFTLEEVVAGLPWRKGDDD